MKSRILYDDERGLQRFQLAFEMPNTGNLLSRSRLATKMGIRLRELGNDSRRNLFHHYHSKPGKIAHDLGGIESSAREKSVELLL
ncbi:MAG TPA: hypothetical protein VGF37_06760 [Chthoniobacterales bacterium]|jgi:hypothetical protein